MDILVGNDVLRGGKKYNGEIKDNICRKPPKTIGFRAKSKGFIGIVVQNLYPYSRHAYCRAGAPKVLAVRGLFCMLGRDVRPSHTGPRCIVHARLAQPPSSSGYTVIPGLLGRTYGEDTPFQGPYFEKAPWRDDQRSFSAVATFYQN